MPVICFRDLSLPPTSKVYLLSTKINNSSNKNSNICLYLFSIKICVFYNFLYLNGRLSLKSLNSDVRYFFNNELNYHTDYDDYFGLKSIQIINTFTNGEIYDNHYTLDGHIKMGELFLEHIIKNRKYER